MAAAPPVVSDATLAPVPTTTLASNNPFRRGTSPNSPDAETAPLIASANARPVSRNPFLDDFNIENRPLTQQRSNSPTKPMPTTAERLQQGLNTNASPLDALAGLTLNEQSASSRNIDSRRKPLPPANNGSKHRTTRSQDEDGPARVERSGRSRPRPVDAVVSPRRRDGNGRPRRNSESSVMESDEERKRRERRQKEREARYKDKDGKIRDPSSKPRRPNKRIDLIDKLDVTGIHGIGFHHDGPFDACNPQRNRKGMKSAPMQAFPEGSANNAIGGSGPVNKGLDFERIHGQGAEGFTDYNTTKVDPFKVQRRAILERQYILNPRERAEQVHGEESAGLGTSTFLEGAPASRVSMQRRENDAMGDPNGAGGGLQRKKSIVQKIRGMSKPRPDIGNTGRVMSPESRYAYAEGESPVPDGVRTAPVGPQSAGAYGKTAEINPFFSDVDKTSNGVKTTEVEETPVEGGRARAPSSPSRGIIWRTTTQESMESPEQKAGLLSRVKSLKGGKRARPERRAPEAAQE